MHTVRATNWLQLPRMKTTRHPDTASSRAHRKTTRWPSSMEATARIMIGASILQMIIVMLEEVHLRCKLTIKVTNKELRICKIKLECIKSTAMCRRIWISSEFYRAEADAQESQNMDRNLPRTISEMIWLLSLTYCLQRWTAQQHSTKGCSIKDIHRSRYPHRLQIIKQQ